MRTAHLHGVNRISYVLPLRSDRRLSDEFVAYVRWLASRCEVIVVDGSPGPVFDDLDRRCANGIRHLSPDGAFRHFLNGKVAGVLTGVGLATHERVVIADDDVRYDDGALDEAVRGLDGAEIVRPQNYFDPHPWHACVDTARTLINRTTGGDWPGTLVVRRSALLRSGGYRGDVLFENLELVRTIVALGGRERVAYGLFVRRLPPPTRHFLSQRVRQAYDEFARPLRMGVWLALIPALALLRRRYGRRALFASAVAAIGCAEVGRRRAGGTRVFPLVASLLAPMWLLERGVCAWLALGVRVVRGGVPYRGRILRQAATPFRELRRAARSRDRFWSLSEPERTTRPPRPAT